MIIQMFHMKQYYFSKYQPGFVINTTATLIALSFATVAVAQNIQIGVKSGIGQLGYNAYNTGEQRKANTWDRGLFLRYINNGGWAFEVNGNHYKYSDSYVPCNCQCFDLNRNIAGRTYEIVNRENIYNNYELNVVVQYNLVCKKIKERCKALSKLDYYIGTIVGVTRTRTKTVTDYIFTDVENAEVNQHKGLGMNHTIVSLGINNTIAYRITDKLSLNNTTSASAAPYNIVNFNKERINNTGYKLSCNFGIAYNL